MTDKLVAAIRAERLRQHGMWGEQNHTPMVWMSILGEEFGEVCHAANEGLQGHYENYREELVQLIAVAVATYESAERNKP